MFELTGKNALITGATGPIGTSIARVLHAQGAAVAISGTRREVLDRLAADLGGRVHVLPCNLADSAETEALVPRVEEAMGQLPWAVCQNEKQFREIMEQWNLLIYEMSGGAKSDMSAFSQTGPESRVRQDLRNLRSLYSMEVKAIMEEGKQRIAVEVSKVFQDLVGRGQLPGNPDEWSRAYTTFLGRLEAYLSWISDQLRR
jgi:enoyl-[acyl-carrier-protein] reductase (NADH)